MRGDATDSAVTVSVLIPVFNGEKYLREAIESILGQEGVAFELVVWDDASTDGSVAVAESFSGVKVARNDRNLGVYVTRQRALAGLRGRYFLNLDADNCLRRGALRRLVDRMEASGDDVAFVYGQRAYIGEMDGVSHFPEFDPEELKIRNYCDMCSLLRMDVLREVGFDPAFNGAKGDYDLFLTLASKGWRGVLLDEVIQDYRVHGESITARLKGSGRQLDVARQLIAKHGAFFGDAAGAAFVQRAKEMALGDLRARRELRLGWEERRADLRAVFLLSRRPYDWFAQIWRTILPPRREGR